MRRAWQHVCPEVRRPLDEHSVSTRNRGSAGDSIGRCLAIGAASLCENSSRGLRGVTIIEFEHAAEPLTALDRASSRQWSWARCVRCPILRAEQGT